MKKYFSKYLVLVFFIFPSIVLCGEIYFTGNQLVDLDWTQRSAQVLSIPVSISAYFGNLSRSGQWIIGTGQLERNWGDDIIRGYSLYLVSSDGENKPVGIPDSVVTALPSPVHDEIAVITRENELHLLAISGEDRLLVPKTQPVTQANWSPDGTKLVYVGWPEGWKFSSPETAHTEEEFDRAMESDLYILDLKTGQITRLTDSPKQDFKPLWSPDGQKILFVSARTRFLSFFMTDPDGSNQTQITNIDFKRDRPHTPVQTNNIIQWNPKGNGLAYQTSVKAYEKSVWYIQTDGSNSRMLGLGTHPQWDNTGLNLIFTQPDGHLSIWNSKDNSIQTLGINQ